MLIIFMCKRSGNTSFLYGIINLGDNMSKKTIFIIVGCVVLVIFTIIGFIVLPPIASEYKDVSEEVKKEKSGASTKEEARTQFTKNDEPKDADHYREEDGILINTSGKIASMHEASYFQVSDMKIRTLKDNPKMAEIEARITNNSDLVIDNTGVFITFSFADGSTTGPYALPAKYIPVGGTITAKTQVLNRIIDADDFTFMIQSFNGGGAG